MSLPNTPNHYRKDIDGLRAIAVLLVVVFHAFPKSMPGGFIGVDVFFVISGYLISAIILRDLNQGNFSFKHFYMRRIKRILPALLTVLSACLTFGWFALLSDEYQLLGKHTAGGALFISNILLWGESGYFDTIAELKPLLHLWSLGIEEQFYLFWPLILWLASKFKFNLLATTLVLLIGSFILNLFELSANPVADFYSPLTRFWELLIGATLAWWTLQEKKSPLSTATTQWLSILGMFFIFLGCKVIDKNSAFPGWLALLPVLGATSLIAAGENAWINRFLLSNRIIVWIGVISFPLYLWHWPILVFAKFIEGDEVRSHIRFWLMILAVILSWLTYTFIEKPIRFGSQSAKKVYALLLWLALLAALGVHIFLNDGYPFRAQLNNSTITETVRDQLVGADWKYKQNQTCLKQHPFEQVKEYGWWFCIQNKDEPPSIIILGSSFANHLYPGFIYNQQLQHRSILNIGACSVALEDDDPNTIGTHPCAYKRPSSQRAFIHQLIAQQNTVKFVILSGFSAQVTEPYLESIRKEVLALRKHHVQLIVFTSHVQPGFDPRLCFSAPLRKELRDCTFPSSKLNTLQEQFEPIRKTILKADPTALFFDPNAMYCDGKVCSFISNGMPLNRDHGHFSEYGSIQLHKYFNLWAKKNAPNLFNAD
jgi:peptidoglycan/LPS O-acetylase OafA/YrhL